MTKSCNSSTTDGLSFVSYRHVTAGATTPVLISQPNKDSSARRSANCRLASCHAAGKSSRAAVTSQQATTSSSTIVCSKRAAVFRCRSASGKSSSFSSVSKEDVSLPPDSQYALSSIDPILQETSRARDGASRCGAFRKNPYRRNAISRKACNRNPSHRNESQHNISRHDVFSILDEKSDRRDTYSHRSSGFDIKNANTHFRSALFAKKKGYIAGESSKRNQSDPVYKQQSMKRGTYCPTGSRSTPDESDPLHDLFDCLTGADIEAARRHNVHVEEAAAKELIEERRGRGSDMRCKEIFVRHQKKDNVFPNSKDSDFRQSLKDALYKDVYW